jgi:hypothetical protein
MAETLHNKACAKEEIRVIVPAEVSLMCFYLHLKLKTGEMNDLRSFEEFKSSESCLCEEGGTSTEVVTMCHYGR